MTHFFASYLSFSKKERTGIIVILSLIIFFVILPFVFPFFVKTTPENNTNFKNELATLKEIKKDSNNHFQYKNYDEENNYPTSFEKKYSSIDKGELFYFDPNTASFNDWQRLGVKDKTIATIKNYLAKGGKFYKPQDIAKIWGLHPNEIEKLIPYIQIEKVENNFSKNNYQANNYQSKTYEKSKYTPTVVDINNADTTAYIALPGIGSKLASRIINFREKLGGFYKVDQIAETFGLPDSTFQKIKTRLILNDRNIKQININTASIDELKTHPYIRYAIANTIVQYRNQHGNYATINDLKKIVLITDEIFNKISPYIKTN